MTWIYKTSGDPKALIAAEYECPEHGRFEITVPRDHVPDTKACPSVEERPWRSARDLGGPWYHVCGRASPWRFPSPARTQVQRVTAARRGKDPEPPPGAFDWRSLAEGQDHDEWEAVERKKDLDYVYKSVKKQVIG